MKSAALLAACSAGFCFQPIAAAQAYDIEVIAMSGAPVPGLPDGFVYLDDFDYLDEFQHIQLNDQGDVLFRTVIIDKHVTNYYGEAVMRKLSGSDVQLLAKELDTASGVLGNAFYFQFRGQSLRQNGECVFGTGLYGLHDSHSSALFTVRPESNIGLLLGDHDPVPGLPSRVDFDHFRSAQFTALDRGTNGLAMKVRVRGEGSGMDQAAFAPSDGAPFTAIAQRGTTPPGQPADVLYDYFDLPELNSAGQGVLSTRLSGQGVTQTDNTLILKTDPDAPPSVFLRAGQQAPSHAEGVIYEYVHGASINDLGQICFRASLSGPGINDTNDDGYFAVTLDSAHHTLVRLGGIAPGFPSDDEVRIQSIHRVHFNESGQYVLHARIAGDSIDPAKGGAIYRGTIGSDPQLMVRAGEQAADLPQGVTYGGFSSYHSTRFSDNGHVAFFATCNNNHPLSDNTDALFAISPDGDVRRVFRTRYRIYTDPDLSLNKYETVTLISKPLAINNAGQVLFVAYIQSGSLLILATPNPCPPDINGDGMLSPADFTAWIDAFHSMAPKCDQNADGACTTSDFTAWINNYNTGC